MFLQLLKNYKNCLYIVQCNNGRALFKGYAIVFKETNTFICSGTVVCMKDDRSRDKQIDKQTETVYWRTKITHNNKRDLKKMQ